MSGEMEESNSSEFEIREQDRWLPIANVGRIMRKCLPESAKISKEGKECVQECVSEFISFITSEAVDRCNLDKRKTLNGEDILFAMHTLGFENYAETLKIYLAKYREKELLEAEKRRAMELRAKKKKRENNVSDELVNTTEIFYNDVDIAPENVYTYEDYDEVVDFDGLYESE